MNHIRQHPFLSAMLINFVLFSIVFASGFPIFNSGDDVFLLYLLGGGFGQAPTELLHYHYGMHPYIGLALKNLFIQFPNLNWYTASLYFFHFVASVIILSQWIKRNALAYSLAGYVLCFVVIEFRFLLQPTFTNTALITAIGGLLLLYDGFRTQHKAHLRLIAGCTLVVMASLFRLHLLIPAIVIALPFFIKGLSWIQLKRLAWYVGGSAILIAVFVLLQHQYYKQHIHGWQNEESYRQAVIHHYNIPKKIPDTASERIRINATFLETGILWDKQFLSKKQIAVTTAAVKVPGAWQQTDFKERLYWLLIENRINIVLVILFFLWKLPLLNRAEKTASISSALLFFVLCTGLLLFRKLPAYIIPGGILALLAFTATLGEKLKTNSSIRVWIFIIASVLILSWAAIRVYKLNGWNKQQHLKWQCAYKQVAASSRTLFVVTDDKFPTDYFHVWDVPHRYALPNLLYKDHFLNNPWINIYERFGIVSPLQFANRNRIVFTGAPSESIKRYYELQTGKKAHFVIHPTNGNCISTWQLSGVYIP